MRCHDKGAELKCDELMSRKDCTANPTCQFHPYDDQESSMPAAHHKGMEDNAVGYDTNPAMSQDQGHCSDKGTNTCQWVTDEYKCSPEQTPGCAWDARSHRCRELRNKDEL